MKSFFGDLHIHIGAGSNGKAVKITASRKLNFASIARESLFRKGLDLVGIIDCASPVVINDIEKLISKGEMSELKKGGIKYRELVIIPGAEIESREGEKGSAHYLTFFPHLEQIREFSNIMEQYITNINLSSQATGLSGSEILQVVEEMNGILIPAHAFTPHKSFYGRCFKSYRECFTQEEWNNIPALELGLSADTMLADYLPELENKIFLSNSDAHSAGKIAREYNRLQMKELNFQELKLALKAKKGRRITANYGLDPRLGKYHRTYCRDCEKNFSFKRAVLNCPECGGDRIVVGVRDRVLNIADKADTNSLQKRPPYIHQVPLMDIPGIGPRTMEKLLEEFGTEMSILHQTSYDDMVSCVGKRITENIIRARSGRAQIKSGGGGNYGKVVG